MSVKFGKALYRSSSLTASKCPDAQLRWRAVIPSLSWWSTSAPCSSNTVINFTKPPWATHCNGVRLKQITTKIIRWNAKIFLFFFLVSFFFLRGLGEEVSFAGFFRMSRNASEIGGSNFQPTAGKEIWVKEDVFLGTIVIRHWWQYAQNVWKAVANYFWSTEKAKDRLKT